MHNYTIGQISKKVNLSTKTIRFYEESGIILPAQRGANGYRVYPESAVEELQLIRSAKDLGLPISEIKKLMGGCEKESCHHSREQVTTTINNYTALLTKQITEFTLLKSKLNKLKENLCKDTDCNKNKYCCNLLKQLSDIK